MKLNKFASLLVIGLALTVAVSGCKKRPGQITPLPGGMTRNPSELPPGGALGTNTNPGGETTTGIPLEGPDKYKDYIPNAEILKGETVFFAFDSSVIRPVEKSKVAKVADYMKGNPTHALEVDGHCDERGTEEYNRALGERRALSAREELTRLGIDPSRIITKTFGKDRPIEPLHSEAAWSKNRRDEFVVLTPPNK